MPPAKAKPKKKSSAVKPTGFLASLAAMKKYETLVVGPVGEHLLAKRLRPTGRREDVLHPSEMAKADWCPRQTYYRLAGTPATSDGEKFSDQLERIFEEGHDIHAKWQNWLAEMGRLWGRWECAQKHYEVYATSDGVMACPQCALPLLYKEVPLEAEERYRIAGHADGAMEDVAAILEIKSIGLGTLRMEEPSLLRDHQVETTDGKKVYDLDGLWKGIRRPLRSHLRQTNIYLALAKEMGLPFDRVIFIYEYKATQAVKEFVVKYSPTIAEPLLDQALDVKYHISKGTPPLRPDHTGQDTKVCKECPFMTECWGTNEGRTKAAEPGGESSSEPGTPGDAPTRKAIRRRPRTTPGPHRARRQRPDVSVHRDDSVGVVRSGEAGVGRGGRKVRRRRLRTAESDQYRGE